jgi:hypothetical protein
MSGAAIKRNGIASPLIGMSPAQISRRGMEEAVKNSNTYSLTALAEYSELERSSDIVLTSLMTTEMRAAEQIRIQNLKNRDGAVVAEPINLYCDLKGAFGIVELKERTQEETISALHKIARI